MTFRDIVDKYMGWCPRFTSVKVQMPPFSSLPLGGKAAVVILLAAWALSSVVAGYSGINYVLQIASVTIGFDMTIISYGILYVSPILQGLTLLALLLDYISSPTILRRQRVELAILLGLQVAREWSIFVLLPSLITTTGRGGLPPFMDLWMLAQRTIIYLGVITETLLILYLIKRLLSGKAVLTKWTFLLVFTVFIAQFAQYFFFTLGFVFPGNIPVFSLSPRDIIFGLANYLVFAAVALFSVRTFMALRNGGGFELVLPRVLRISIVFYAFVYGVSEAWNSYLSANLAFSFNLSKAVFLVLGASFYIGLIAACIFPPRLQLGEDIRRE
jgi:hypothetical protein